jgi:hypothetical protein
LTESWELTDCLVYKSEAVQLGMDMRFCVLALIDCACSRASLRYVENLIKEVFRWWTIAPVAIGHELTEDDEYNGMYSIPVAPMNKPELSVPSPRIFYSKRSFFYFTFSGLPDRSPPPRHHYHSLSMV